MSATEVGAHGLLSLWERAAPLSPIERSLALAEAAGEQRAVLLERPVGSTNRRLLDLRERLAGDLLPATASCPSCGERAEFSVRIEEFRQRGAGLPVEGWRPPTPADLLAVADEPDPVAALRERCLTAPAQDLARIESEMAAADPLAETIIELTCPACGTGFEVDLDIGAFVWQEVDAAARRLLLDVDTLARVYGWTEAEVLALSDTRRAAYLRMATGGAP